MLLTEYLVKPQGNINVLHEHQDYTATDWYLQSYIYILHLWHYDNMESCHRQNKFKYILFKNTIFNFCLQF